MLNPLPWCPMNLKLFHLDWSIHWCPFLCCQPWALPLIFLDVSFSNLSLWTGANQCLIQCTLWVNLQTYEDLSACSSQFPMMKSLFLAGLPSFCFCIYWCSRACLVLSTMQEGSFLQMVGKGSCSTLPSNVQFVILVSLYFDFLLLFQAERLTPMPFYFILSGSGSLHFCINEMVSIWLRNDSHKTLTELMFQV